MNQKSGRVRGKDKGKEQSYLKRVFVEATILAETTRILIRRLSH